MSYTKRFKKDRSYLLNAVNFPTPYQQCKDSGYRTFSSKNNRKQIDTVCSGFPISGHIDLSGKTDSSIKNMTIERCGEFSSNYNFNRCAQGVMNILNDDMIRYRDASKTAADQAVEELRIANEEIVQAELDAQVTQVQTTAQQTQTQAQTPQISAAQKAANRAAGRAAAKAAARESVRPSITPYLADSKKQAGILGGNTGTLIGVAAAVGAVGWLVFSARNKKKKRKK